jgi:hypothetical protein
MSHDPQNQTNSSNSFEPIVPGAQANTMPITNTTTEVFKRRLSEVAWSHTMEVSEEKRYKMANRRK